MINDKLNKDILDSINENAESITKLKLKLLWTNPNPTGEMSGNTNINLSSSDYDMLIWIFDFNTNVAPHIHNSAICLKGQNTRLCGMIANGSDNTSTRDLVYVSNTQYTAGDGMLKATAQSRRCVPIYCYGLKFNF